MNKLLSVVLILVVCCGVAHAGTLVVTYEGVGITASVSIACDWAHVIFLRGVPPVVCWGRGPEPLSAGEALWRMEGLRNDYWSNATFEPTP